MAKNSETGNRSNGQERTKLCWRLFEHRLPLHHSWVRPARESTHNPYICLFLQNEIRADISFWGLLFSLIARRKDSRSGLVFYSILATLAKLLQLGQLTIFPPDVWLLEPSKDLCRSAQMLEPISTESSNLFVGVVSEQPGDLYTGDTEWQCDPLTTYAKLSVTKGYYREGMLG